MGLYAASEQVQVSESVLHEFSQEYRKRVRAHTHTHTHTHKLFYFEHRSLEGSEASHQSVKWFTAHLMVFPQQPWWFTPPATLSAPKLAAGHGTSARELASSWSETEGLQPESWVVLQSAEDGRDPHSQHLCIDHTAEDQVGCDPKAHSGQDQSMDSLRTCQHGGGWRPSTPLCCSPPLCSADTGQTWALGALKDKVNSPKRIGGLLGGRSLRVVKRAVLKYLKGCYIEGPEIYLRCWG